MNRLSLWSILILAGLTSALALSFSECGVAQQGKVEADKEKQKAQTVSRGKIVFVKATCWGCHPHGENSLHGDKPLKGPGFAKKYKSDQSIIDFVRKGSPNEGMPPFPKDKLSDQDLKSVIVFIRSLSTN